MRFDHVVVFGSNGRFGRVFGQRLESLAGRLTGIDVTLSENASGEFIDPQTHANAVHEAVRPI